MTDAERLARALNARLDREIADLLADGKDPPAIVTLVLEQPDWSAAGFTQFAIERRIQLLLRDTTALARRIAKAKSAEAMLEVLETGDTKDKLAVLKGIQVLGEVVEHKGEVVTRFVVETHDGAPPKPEDAS